MVLAGTHDTILRDDQKYVKYGGTMCAKELSIVYSKSNTPKNMCPSPKCLAPINTTKAALDDSQCTENINGVLLFRECQRLALNDMHDACCVKYSLKPRNFHKPCNPRKKCLNVYKACVKFVNSCPHWQVIYQGSMHVEGKTERAVEDTTESN